MGGDGRNLRRLVSWAQELVGEVLHHGDLAVDLTAGTGRDTLFLFRRVGPAGCVVAFDIQEAALRTTAELLRGAGARVEFRTLNATAPFSPGVHLIAASHSALEQLLTESPRGILANLGYLPGGNPAITTSTATTMTALEHACRRLQPGGRIAVTAYVGHENGRKEGEVVGHFFASLPPRQWDVLRLEVPNRPGSPFLLAAQKR